MLEKLAHAVEFNTNGEYINYGSASELDDIAQGTILLWLKDDRVHGESVIQKSASFQGFKLETFLTRLDFTINRATTTLEIRTSTDPIAASDTWSFVAILFDFNGSDGDQQMWSGDLSTAISEESYTVQTVGSGSRTSDASNDMLLGNYNDGLNPCTCTVGFFAIYDVVLTTEQISAIQWDPRNAYDNCLLMSFPSDSAADLCSDNEGTINGSPGTTDGLPLVFN